MPTLDVGQLVDEGLAGLRVGHVVADPQHHMPGGVGVAVGLPARSALDAVAVAGDLGGQGVPQPSGGLTLQQGGQHLGQVVPIGLRLVEDVRDREAHPPTPARAAALAALPRGVGGVGGGVLATATPAGAGGQDRDALLALADLAAEGPPRGEPGNPGRVGALHKDQELVGGAVGVEPARGVEHRPPLVGAGEGLDPGGDVLVQVREAGGLGGGALGALLRGGGGLASSGRGAGHGVPPGRSGPGSDPAPGPAGGS